MLVSALLKSSATDRASCSAQSSFCFCTECTSVAGGFCPPAWTGSGSNCKTKYFCPPSVREQMAVWKELTPPPLTRYFTLTAGDGEIAQFPRNSSAVVPFSGDQIAESDGCAPSNGGPNVFTAALVARKTLPPPS